MDSGARSADVTPPKVKLLPFWPKDPNSWFMLAEFTFNRHNLVDSRLPFDLVLPALQEEVIEQIRGVLRAVDHLDCPYVDLKARLLQLLTPRLADTCHKFIHGRELGKRRPTQLMETMLALLPPREEDSILFKLLYVIKLSKEVRSHVLAHGMHLDSREMADLADDLWCGMNECHSGSKSHHVAAAVHEDGDELEEAVAVLNVQPKWPQPKKKKAAKPPRKLCRSHKKFRDQMWKCADPPTCTWLENE